MHLALALSVPLAFLAPRSAPERIEPGQPAPDFALPDLEGRKHQLSELRGRIVVLEWTSHLCPAVAHFHETRLASDARAALDPARVAWLQVDSSWFAPELADDVRAWRRRLALEAPYLLDADGAVARSYGITATPELVVIDAQGVLAYRGGMCEDAPEPERSNHVVEAVRALLEGRELATTSTPARGCSVKFRDPDERTSAEEWDENGRAWQIYAEAAAAARAGRFEEALATLEGAFEARHPRPACVLSDPAFRALLADAEARVALRELLDARPARGFLTLVAPDEPGEAFVLCGTVRDESGRPVEGALVSLFHTDAAGWYSPGSMQGENARLSASLRTDRNGRYRVRTVLPNYYSDTLAAGSDDGLQHVHMGFKADGHRAHEGHEASLYFEDDPHLVGANRAEIEGDGCGVRPRTKNAEGLTICVYDVVLPRK